MPQSDSDRPQLYFVRHGETEWSLSHQHTGRTDLPLTPHGEQQAIALAPWLARTSFSHVFTSPLQRASRTCALAGASAATPEPDLMEWHYGGYEGRRTADIHAERPGWDVFRDGCPGGESPADIAARADRLIARLSRLHGNIALFSHGEFGDALAARWIGLEVAQARHFYLNTASLSILAYRPGHPDTRVIQLWNAVPGGFG
jgi:probable phosphoglycerate mutase